MVDLMIIGSIGLDDIETPFGKVKGVLGGSAAYAAYAASFFTKPGIVAPIGEDFPVPHTDLLKENGIDLEGLEKSGKTFRWEGFYEFDMNEAKTRKTELNCLVDFKAEIPDKYKKAKFVFLGNMDPDLQLKVLGQLDSPALVAIDTMNFWIESKKEKLLEVMKKIDVVIFNDGEARQLFDTANLVTAANETLKLGPRAVIIKKGEHGALLFTKDSHFSAGGYPLEVIKDPTGCGDCFGGGFIGYLAKVQEITDKSMRRAVVYGSAVASFNAEDFSLENLKRINSDDIEKRFHEFREMKEF